MKKPLPASEHQKTLWYTLRKTLAILALLALFIFALDLMISSLRHLGSTAANTIIRATSDPFTGLFIGLLVTAIVQSSSTTTSMIVALVVSGSVALENAVPMIMGANVGTTITSTVVSLGFLNKKRELRRAVAAGTYHDFFNILMVVILFPLEYFYGTLSVVSQFVAGRFFSPAVAAPDSGPHHLLPGSGYIIDFLAGAISSDIALVLVAGVLLFISVLLFRRLISNLVIARSPRRFSRFFFRNKLKSFSWGIIITALIRSSTVTTSIVVPLAAKKIVKLQKAAPFILGANIGTTITAFIAATLNATTTGVISLAIAHFLFNFTGVLIFLPFPALQKIPLKLAVYMGRLTYKYTSAGFIYLLIVFFIIPFLLIYLSRSF